MRFPIGTICEVDSDIMEVIEYFYLIRNASKFAVVTRQGVQQNKLEVKFFNKDTFRCIFRKDINVMFLKDTGKVVPVYAFGNKTMGDFHADSAVFSVNKVLFCNSDFHSGIPQNEFNNIVQRLEIEFEYEQGIYGNEPWEFIMFGYAFESMNKHDKGNTVAQKVVKVGCTKFSLYQLRKALHLMDKECPLVALEKNSRGM